MAFFALAAEREPDRESSPAVRPGSRTCARSRRPIPTLPILLHHQGMVRAVDGLDSPDAREASSRSPLIPNVGVKASGFYYGSRDKAEYPYPEQTAVFERIYRAFGARRLTWGSDFPVSSVGRLHLPRRRSMSCGGTARSSTEAGPAPGSWATRWPRSSRHDGRSPASEADRSRAR